MWITRAQEFKNSLSNIMRFWFVCLFLKERGNRRGRERGSKRGRETVEREDPGLSLREPRGC